MPSLSGSGWFDPVRLKQPVTESIVRAVAMGFGVWTLATHAVVAWGGSLYTLMSVAPIVLVIAVLIYRRLPRGQSTDAEHRIAIADSPRTRVVATGLAVGAVALLLLGAGGIWFWWCAVAGLAWACVLAYGRSSTTSDIAPARPPAAENPWGLPILAAASALFALLLHKPEPDDGWYIATAARAVDHPAAPLLTSNPTLGVADLPLSLPAYKVHSLELLAAAVSWISGLPAITVFHLVIGPLVAALLPLAYASLYRRVLPGHELRATALTLGIMVLFPRTPYGGDPFAHPWIGGTVFLALLVPLIGTAAWDLARGPSARRFLRLGLAQIAAIGATSTALWAAPITATYFGIAALVNARPRERQVRGALLGLASCSYAVAVGLALRAEFAAISTAPLPNRVVPVPEIGAAISHALGSPATIAAIWVGVLVSWAWQRQQAARDLALVVPALFALTLLNPYLSGFVAANITSLYVFDRVLWVLPVPVLLTLLAHALIEEGRTWRRPAQAALTVIVLVGLSGASIWGGFARHGWNNLAILRFPPGLKVPHPTYDVAAHLHRTLGPNRTVLGSRWVSLWLPTFHDPPFPLAPRRQYLDSLRLQGRDDEVVQRLLTAAFLGGEIERWMPFPEPIPDMVAFLDEGLGALRPDALLVAPNMVDRRDVRAVLIQRGYTYRESVEGHAIWLSSEVDWDSQDPP